MKLKARSVIILIDMGDLINVPNSYFKPVPYGNSYYLMTPITN